jgi:hypothetical protein
MNASVHPMFFRERYRKVFAHKWLTLDEPSSSNAQRLLKCSVFSQNPLENFISFPKST